MSSDQAAPSLHWSGHPRDGAAIQELRLRPVLDGELLRFQPDQDGRLMRVVVDLDGASFTQTWLRAVELARTGPSPREAS